MKKLLLMFGLITIGLMSAQNTLFTNAAAPYDVIADSAGNLYISDTANRRVLKTKPDGSDAVMLQPFSSQVFGLLISNNKLFVAAQGVIYKMDLDGRNPEEVVNTAGAYYMASGNDGYIYFVSITAGTIQRVKEDGTDLTMITNNLSSPVGITYDAVLDVLYYTEGGTQSVNRIKKDGTGKQRVASGFTNPHNVRLDASGNIYVADTGNNRIKKISGTNNSVYTFPGTDLNAPTSTFVTTTGRILIADCWGNKIRYIDPVQANYLKFNGVNSYISGTNAQLPQGNDERTIEAMIKAPSQATGSFTTYSIFNYGAYSNGKRFCLMLQRGKLAFVGEYNDTTSAVDLLDDQWHHVAVTLKSNTVRLYVDGVLIQTAALPSLSTAGNSFYIGASDRGRVDELFEGAIDEVRVWNRALAVEEIQNNKNCELADPASRNGLVAYYQFNQGFNQGDNSNVTSLTDATGNSTSTVLNNFELSGTSSNWMDGSLIQTGAGCSLFNPSLACATVTLPNGIQASANPTISWAAVQGAETYKVYVGTASGTYDLVNGATSAGTSYALSGLSSLTTYYVKVVPANTQTEATGCSESSFTTGDAYCEVNNDGAILHIDSVQFSDINHATFLSAQYGNFTSIVANVVKNNTYTMTVNSWDFATFKRAVVDIWIDFNHNEVFEQNEYFRAPQQNGVSFTNIMIPADALPGKTRMRVKMFDPSEENGSSPCGIFNPLTQIFDYTVNIKAPVLAVNDEAKTDISVYPNPVTDLLFVSSTEKVLGYAVYSTDGRKVSGNTQFNSSQIDVSRLPQGVYFLKLTLNNEKQTFRFIKK